MAVSKKSWLTLDPWNDRMAGRSVRSLGYFLGLHLSKTKTKRALIGLAVITRKYMQAI